jgi:hypothetical protein
MAATYIETAWRNPRTYDDPKGRGRRHNANSAVALINEGLLEDDHLDPATFCRWQRKGWHHWQGPDLKPRRLQPLIGGCPPEGGRAEKTYLESELLELREALALTPEERYQRMGRLSRPLAAAIIGLSSGNDIWWKQYEDAGQLDPQTTISPVSGKPETTYSKAKVEEVDQVRRQRFRIKKGQRYIPIEVIVERLQRWLTDVAQAFFHWRKKKSCTPLRGTKLICFETGRTGGGIEWWYLESQIDQIEEALRARHASVEDGQSHPFRDECIINGEVYLTLSAIKAGRGLEEPVTQSTLSRLVEEGFVKRERRRSGCQGGREPWVHCKIDLERYLIARKIPFDGIFTTPHGRAFSLRRAVKELKDNHGFNCSQWFLRQAIQEGGCPYLPEKKLPSLPDQKPATGDPRYQEPMAAILEADLVRLVRAVKAVIGEAADLPPEWQDAGRIADLAGIERKKRPRFFAVLQRGRERGILTTFQRHYRNTVKLVHIYHVPDVIHLADLSESILNELRPGKQGGAKTMPSAHSDGSRYNGPPLPQVAYPVEVADISDTTLGKIKDMLKDVLGPHQREFIEAVHHLQTSLSGPAAVAPGTSDRFRPSADFRSVVWGDEVFTFTPTQAACVRVMWAARANGTPELAQVTILDEAESSRRDDKKPQLRRVFRQSDGTMHQAWKLMILPGSTAGTFYLADPSE